MVTNKTTGRRKLGRRSSFGLLAAAVFAFSVLAGSQFPLVEEAFVFASPDDPVPEFQAELLRDGVEQVEYEGAVKQAVDCMTSQGVEVSELKTGPNGSIDFGFSSSPALGGMAAAEAVYNRCRAAYSSRVEEAWTERPAAEAFAIDWGHRIMRCLERRLGMVFSRDPDAVRKQVSQFYFNPTYTECAAEAGRSLLDESGTGGNAIWGGIIFSPLP